jgi:hypothetical protein
VKHLGSRAGQPQVGLEREFAHEIDEQWTTPRLYPTALGRA